MTNSQKFLRSAGITIGTLFGGIVAGLLLGTVLFHVLPGSDVENPSVMHASIAAIPALAGFLAGGASWGYAMAGFAGVEDRRQSAWAGLLGFGPITLILAVGLAFLEPVIVSQYGDRLPLHRLFTLLFVPSAFLIASIGTWGLGIGLAGPALARQLAWRAGLTSAATFLVVNLAMESAGWVVGAPGAGERATMLVVLFTGLLLAAFTTGGVLGPMVQRNRENPR